jgi:hypothetical protein
MAATTSARSGRHAAKRGNPLPWAAAGHNGEHPISTAGSAADRRKEMGQFMAHVPAGWAGPAIVILAGGRKRHVK